MKISVLFGAAFKRCWYGDQVQLVRQRAVREFAPPAIPVEIPSPPKGCRQAVVFWNWVFSTEGV